MKKIYALAIALFLVSTARSQTNCSNFLVTLDKNHFSTSGDTAFVRAIQFDVANISSVAKIGYTFSNNSGGVIQTQNYIVSSIPASQDLTVTNNCSLNGNRVSISLGYLKYLGTSYGVSINLYDSNNNLLGTGSFNFSN